MKKTYKNYLHTPIGILEIVSSETTVKRIVFVDSEGKSNTDLPDIMKICIKQLEEYFEGKRKTFTIPYEKCESEFQRKIYKALNDVSYGTTASYKLIAEIINNPKAIRAAGTSLGKNDLAIIIPCHRIIGSNGSLSGYRWEAWRKEWLIQHEKNNRA